MIAEELRELASRPHMPQDFRGLLTKLADLAEETTQHVDARFCQLEESRDAWERKYYVAQETVDELKAENERLDMEIQDQNIGRP